MYVKLVCAKFAVWKFLPAHVTNSDALVLGRSPSLCYCPWDRRPDLAGGLPVVLWVGGADHEPHNGEDH